MAELQPHEAAEHFPMHSAEQFAELQDSLRRHGWDAGHPIVLCDGKILDGRNRYAACMALGIEPTFVEFVGNPFEKAWLDNGSRRDLEPGQKGAIRARLNVASERWQAAQRKRREAANEKRSESTQRQPRPEGGRFGPPTGRVSRDTQPVAPQRDTTNYSRTDLAKQAGTSEATAGRVLALQTKRPDLLDKVASGTVKLADAMREAKREEVRAQLEDITQREVKAAAGVYDVIVIDPPWAMEKIERDERPNQVGFDYPTMSEAELEVLPIPCAEACHVWLWTTHRFLPMAFRLLGAWKLNYVCTFVWHKPGGFQPIGLPQYNCEFALYARRGKATFLDTKALPTCFEAPRGAHSEKPDAFYDMIRRVTAGRRLDMFNRRVIEGFDSWGQEAAG